MRVSRLSIGLLGLFAIVSSAQTTQSVRQENVSDTSAKAEIQQVMTSFHEAVATHNGPGVSALVVPDGSTWFNVLSDSEYARALSRNPAAMKVRHSTLEDFTKFVSGTHAALDPQHSNVVINTNGTIAAAYFNFVFLINGKAENRGCETWQLIKTTSGWKIAAVTYSSDPNTER